MSQDQYLHAISMAIENIDDCDLVGPRCENLIVKAEETLGFKFPRDLRQFITDFGAGAIGASEVYGVIDNNPEGAGPPDGVWMTLDARTGWPLPAEFFVLYFDGFEYYYVIDCKSSEDPPILAWIPGETKNSKEAVVSHDSFGELLEELASWIKE